MKYFYIIWELRIPTSDCTLDPWSDVYGIFDTHDEAENAIPNAKDAYNVRVTYYITKIPANTPKGKQEHI